MPSTSELHPHAHLTLWLENPNIISDQREQPKTDLLNQIKPTLCIQGKGYLWTEYVVHGQILSHPVTLAPLVCFKEWLCV